MDILVRLEGESPGFFGFVQLEQRPSDLLGLPVDLVMESALKPRRRDRILDESVAA